MITNPTNEHREQARKAYQPSEADLEIARGIVKRCGLRDGLFKGPRTLNAVETIAYALLDARRAGSKEHNGWQYVHERDAELINSDLFMCEAHPGLDFGHDSGCAGPGMAWIIEGRAAIEALLSSRDAEIREVLEGLMTRRWFGDKPTACWCDPRAYPDSDDDEDHDARCRRARALYAKLQPGKEGKDVSSQVQS